MNQLAELIDQTGGVEALERKIRNLKRLALDQFQTLPPHEQTTCMAALENGEVPGTADFVWTCIVHAGLCELALIHSHFRGPVAQWVGEPIYKVPSACGDQRNTYRVFHRDIEGRIVAVFFGSKSKQMAEHFCGLFGESSGSTKSFNSPAPTTETQG
jgi:hypothetical protein